jgi:hypothetical protein
MVLAPITHEDPLSITTTGSFASPKAFKASELSSIYHRIFCVLRDLRVLRVQRVLRLKRVGRVFVACPK